MERTGIDGFLEDAERWRQVVGTRAASYRRIVDELQELLPIDEALRARLAAVWAGRRFTVFYERPLLVLAALRFDALAAGRSHPLWRALAAPAPDPDTVSRAALAEALDSGTVWDSIAHRYLQTNETSRAVAWLWPAWIAGCDRGARPLALVEIGTSAGMVLVADRLPNVWTDAAGAPLSIVDAPRITRRLGIDRRPLDVRDDEQVAWMRACVWAGEADRLARFEAAVAACRAAPPELEAADALSAPARLRALADGETLTLAFQTIVRDYFPPDVDRAYEEGMRGWLADAPPGRALWTELELSRNQAPEAAITAHVYDGARVVDLQLARTGYHPREVLADEQAVARLRALTAR